MEPLEDCSGIPPDDRPVQLGVKWTSSGGVKHLFRVDLPWDADGNDFAEAFQSMMLAYGFGSSTVTDYVTSKLLNNESEEEPF